MADDRYYITVDFSDEQPSVSFGYRAGPGISVQAHNGLAWEFTGPGFDADEQERLREDILDELPEQSNEIIETTWAGGSRPKGKTLVDVGPYQLAIESIIQKATEDGPQRRGWTAANWFSESSNNELGITRSDLSETQIAEIIAIQTQQIDNAGYQVSGVDEYLRERIENHEDDE